LDASQWISEGENNNFNEYNEIIKNLVKINVPET